MAQSEISAQFVTTLLTQSSLTEQLALLRAASLLDAVGLTALLDKAEHLASDDPNQSLALALIGEKVANQHGIINILPRATYLKAQIHAIKGEFPTALELIEKARNAYLTLGMEQDALRTNVGLMRVFAQTGRYQEAIDAGHNTLAILNAPKTVALSESLESSLLIALIYQNIGVCLEHIGRYTESISAYRAAEHRYQVLSMPERQGNIIENRGLVMMHWGRVQDALAAFEEALIIYRTENLAMAQAETLVNIGEAHLLLGNYVTSLRIFEQATSQLESLGDSIEQPNLLRQVADAYLMLNLYSEAVDTYQKANARLAAMDAVYFHGLSLWGMGMALVAQGRWMEAQEALTNAAQRFQRMESYPMLASVMLEQASLAVLIGEPQEARRLARQAFELVTNSDWTVHKIYACLRNAELLLPDVQAAEPLLRQAADLMNMLDLPHLRYRLNQRLGHWYLLQGNTITAQQHLEKAIAEIEQLRNTLVQERLRASFLDDKIAAYQDLVQLHLGLGDPENLEQAFAIAERAKARSLVDLLSGVITPKSDPTALHSASDLDQQLQRELNAIYNELLGNDQAENSSKRIQRMATLQLRAVEIESEISQIKLRRAANTATIDVALPSSTISSSSHPNLATDVPILVYHLFEDEIIAFVQFKDQLRVVRQLGSPAAVQRLLQQLAAQWSYLRTNSQFAARHLLQLERSAQRLLHLLYNLLMAPALALLETIMPASSSASATRNAAQSLVIVPHGLLHQLPFHALFDGERYLLERFDISYAPSATVFALCQQRPINLHGVAAIFGVPDARIPAVESEIALVEQQLQGQCAAVHLLRHEQATLAALFALMSKSEFTLNSSRNSTGNCTVLHLACHGLFRSDNPMFSALKLYDGWLTAADIIQYDLGSALVTVSACESGRSQAMASDEMMGLSYAFLSAGAAALLVSQWVVQDTTTAALMAHWYQQLVRTNNLAAALRSAQLAIKERYPHPYYWAPFILIGQRQITPKQ